MSQQTQTQSLPQTEQLRCPECQKRFPGDNALKTHVRMTHENPEWIAAKEAKRGGLATKPIPICPRCGTEARVDHTQYGPRASCCGMHSWGLKPLVDKPTHAARIAAHDAFDALWKGGHFSRGEGYRRLQIAMNMTEAECHMEKMSEADAIRVTEIVQKGILLTIA